MKKSKNYNLDMTSSATALGKAINKGCNIFSIIALRFMACAGGLGIIVAFARGFKTRTGEYINPIYIIIGIFSVVFFWLWSNQISRNNKANGKNKGANLKKTGDPFLRIMLLILTASGLFSAITILKSGNMKTDVSSITETRMYFSVAVGIISAVVLWSKRKEL